MPNWCSNDLTVTGPKEEIERWVEFSTGLPPKYKPSKLEEEIFGKPLKNKKEEPEILNFHSICPIPQLTLDFGFDHGYVKDADGNMKPPEGSPECGYDAQCRLWGTKWGACEVSVTTPETCTSWSPVMESEDHSWISYNFDTAWSPPEPLVRAAALLFPDCIFNLTFTGEGYEFKGQLMLKNSLELVSETREGTFSDMVSDSDEHAAWDMYGILDMIEDAEQPA